LSDVLFTGEILKKKVFFYYKMTAEKSSAVILCMIIPGRSIYFMPSFT